MLPIERQFQSFTGRWFGWNSPAWWVGTAAAVYGLATVQIELFFIGLAAVSLRAEIIKTRLDE